MEEDRVRLRLHWGGNFQGSPSQSDWRYVGGEVFNESVPAAFKYFDLCLKLNEKVGYTTSIKYLAPGEELSPNELVSITGDDDLQELYDEYFQALRRPSTPIKTFRVKIYLFPALQLELDTEARPSAETQPQPQVVEQQLFDPEEWCAPSDDEDECCDVEAFPQWHCGEANAADMQWAEEAQHEGAHAWRQRELPSGVMPAFMDRPAGQASGLFGARREDAMAELDRHAIGNLLQSISRSVAMQHPMGITEEIGLLDPYHEQDDDGGRVARVQQQREREAEAQQMKQWAAEPEQQQNPDETTALVRVQEHGDPDGANKYSSLLGNLPSHISIFGSVGGKGGRALSAGADDGVVLSTDMAMGSAGEGQQGKGGIRFPSHISIFGSCNNDLDDADYGVVREHAGQAGDAAEAEAAGEEDNCITQEFSRDGSMGKQPRDVCLADDVDFGKGTMDSVSVSTPKLLDEVVKVPIDEVHIIRKIGEGAFGEVSFANVESHGLVAVKWLKRDRFAKYSESFMREAEVLAKLNHPNIIRMYGVVVEPVERGFVGSTLVDSGFRSLPEQQYIIAGIMTDFVRGGSLSGQLRAAKRRPTLKERCQVAVQAARGMAFLHAQNPAVIHFDLKPDNLLVDGDGETLHVKVADFGLSKHKFQTFVSCRDLRGTLPYMAPELVSNPNQVSERCDVWSMGVVMWEMYTLEVPYHSMSAQQILMALMHGNIHLHVPSSCEPEWRGLIEMCMDPNPEARPSFKQLTTHLDALLRQLQ